MNTASELKDHIVVPNSNDASQEQPLVASKETLDSAIEKIENEDKNDLSNSTCEEYKVSAEYVGESSMYKRRKIELYTEDKGPKLYAIKGKLVTPTLCPKNLPDAFDVFPIFGRPAANQSLEEFQKSKIKEFVGCVLNDDEFETLSKYCSPNRMKTGKELVMSSPYPTPGLSEIETTYLNKITKDDDKGNHLCVVKKHKLRVEKDKRNQYPIKLKYRSLRVMSLGSKNEMFSTEQGQISSTEQVPQENLSSTPVSMDEELQPGKDLLYFVRVYRPFHCNQKDKSRGRMGVLNCVLCLHGRQPLSALRDCIGCCNDLAARLDVSAAPRAPPPPTAKELFPSGFLFINNVFYVDTRPGCGDKSEGVRAWARRRGLGDFPRHGLEPRLQDVPLRLGHPEVFVHQGKCEHLFTFSAVRLATAADPLRPSTYPARAALSHNQTVYCMTCAAFGAKWLVTGCARVPFDPAFFCEPCFYRYLYVAGAKVGDFKAYAFKGNEVNLLKSSA